MPPADTAIDEEARNRSTSTYLVERRLDMLPVRAREAPLPRPQLTLTSTLLGRAFP